MKYAIILPDGAADEPLPELGGRTPLAAAYTPNMDSVARMGRLGRVRTIPDGFDAGTDVGTMTLFGYDPRRYYTGRAPLEAAARGLTPGPDELVFRCNFVTIIDGCMRSFSAGHITQAEAEPLITLLNESAAAGLPAFEGCTFYSGVGYRNLMVAQRATEFDLRASAPHDIPNLSVAEYLPRGRGAARIHAVMDQARELLRHHSVNRARRAADKAPVTDIWLWGQGRPAPFESFAARFGVRCAVITAVDIIRGLAVCAGMQLVEVPGATGGFDTDYAAKGRFAVAALDDYDVVIVHIEATDEAAHAADAAEKVRALQCIDEHIVGPLLDALRRRGGWRLLIAPDHVTSTLTTQHAATPPPYCFAGSDVAPGERRPFDEAEALASGRLLENGHELIGRFLATGDSGE